MASKQKQEKLEQQVEDLKIQLAALVSAASNALFVYEEKFNNDELRVAMTALSTLVIKAQAGR